MARRFGALLLAAGASQRMGSPKALLAWGDVSLIEYSVQQLRAAAVGELVVVLGPATNHLAGQLGAGNVRVAFNPEPATGRSTSIRIGALALPDDLEALIVQSVDQPCESSVLDLLLNGLLAHTADVAVPVFAGRRGHPVCLAGRLVAELRTVTEEEQGLRSIVRRHAQHLVEIPVSAKSVIWNLNSPAAYAAARAAAGLTLD